MSYISLYRKYRPKKFSDVVGQEVVIKILKNSIVNNKIGHAYIFSGPRGTGKTSVAKIFSKAVNCLSPEDGDLCDKCEVCKLNFDDEIDIIEIDAASNNGVDEIREIRNNVKLLPVHLKYKSPHPVRQERAKPTSRCDTSPALSNSAVPQFL